MIVLEYFCELGSELNEVKTQGKAAHNFEGSLEDNIAYCKVAGRVAGNGHELMADNEVGREKIAGYELENWLGMSTVGRLLTAWQNYWIYSLAGMCFDSLEDSNSVRQGFALEHQSKLPSSFERYSIVEGCSEDCNYD